MVLYRRVGWWEVDGRRGCFGSVVGVVVGSVVAVVVGSVVAVVVVELRVGPTRYVGRPNRGGERHAFLGSLWIGNK